MSEGSEDEGYEGSPLSPGAAAEGRGKAVWTQQDDDMLRQAVAELGSGKWVQVSEHLAKRGASRTAKAARTRWQRIWFTDVEDAILLKGYEVHGDKWNELAQLIPGRTEVDMRTRYHQLAHRKRPISSQYRNLGIEQLQAELQKQQRATNTSRPITKLTPAQHAQLLQQLLRNSRPGSSATGAGVGAPGVPPQQPPGVLSAPQLHALLQKVIKQRQEQHQKQGAANPHGSPNKPSSSGGGAQGDTAGLDSPKGATTLGKPLGPGLLAVQRSAGQQSSEGGSAGDNKRRRTTFDTLNTSGCLPAPPPPIPMEPTRTLMPSASAAAALAGSGSLRPSWATSTTPVPPPALLPSSSLNTSRFPGTQGGATNGAEVNTGQGWQAARSWQAMARGSGWNGSSGGGAMQAGGGPHQLQPGQVQYPGSTGMPAAPGTAGLFPGRQLHPQSQMLPAARLPGAARLTGDQPQHQQQQQEAGPQQWNQQLQGVFDLDSDMHGGSSGGASMVGSLLSGLAGMLGDTVMDDGDEHALLSAYMEFIRSSGQDTENGDGLPQYGQQAGPAFDNGAPGHGATGAAGGGMLGSLPMAMHEHDLHMGLTNLGIVRSSGGGGGGPGAVAGSQGIVGSLRQSAGGQMHMQFQQGAGAGAGRPLSFAEWQQQQQQQQQQQHRRQSQQHHLQEHQHHQQQQQQHHHQLQHQNQHQQIQQQHLQAERQGMRSSGGGASDMSPHSSGMHSGAGHTQTTGGHTSSGGAGAGQGRGSTGQQGNSASSQAGAGGRRTAGGSTSGDAVHQPVDSGTEAAGSHHGMNHTSPGSPGAQNQAMGYPGATSEAAPPGQVQRALLQHHRHTHSLPADLGGMQVAGARPLPLGSPSAIGIGPNMMPRVSSTSDTNHILHTSRPGSGGLGRPGSNVYSMEGGPAGPNGPSSGAAGLLAAAWMPHHHQQPQLQVHHHMLSQQQPWGAGAHQAQLMGVDGQGRAGAPAAQGGLGHPPKSLHDGPAVMMADAAAVVTAPGDASPWAQGTSVGDKASRAAAYKREGLQKLKMLPDDVRQCVMAAARMYCNAVLDAGGTLPGMAAATQQHYQQHLGAAAGLEHATSYVSSISPGSRAAVGRDGSDPAVIQQPISAAAM